MATSNGIFFSVLFTFLPEPGSQDSEILPDLLFVNVNRDAVKISSNGYFQDDLMLIIMIREN